MNSQTPKILSIHSTNNVELFLHFNGDFVEIFILKNKTFMTLLLLKIIYS